MFDPLCDVCKQKMVYSVMYREKGTLEWKFYCINVLGKDNAYLLVQEAKPRKPVETEWRVFSRNVADAILYGIKLGKEIGESAGVTYEELPEYEEDHSRHRPVVFMPDHL